MRFLIAFLVILGMIAACPNFDKYLNLFCKYGTEPKPCTIENYSAFKTACCSLSGKCSFSEFPKDQVCCFKQACLDRCFPGKRYQMGSVY
ncbi:unnamed protein product [Caenorhabditis bovis]|uniref:WAP domain-containing protein n=1 Tax=Caenorhabditis bovis TaxID=2654633 RepID=A0A8S1EKV7_9PELO|nr:unnamed protein product [Caenorhabditis bovis]